MAYSVGLLNQDRTIQAENQNNRLLSRRSLGIEVTSTEFSTRCMYGNIDPQHLINGRSSAIEESLVAKLPPDGTLLVTQKLDKDSVGAMAVLMIRLECASSLIDGRLVAWIGMIDRMGFSKASKRCSMLAAHFDETKEIRAMDAIIYEYSRHYSLGEKVSLVASILTHEMPQAKIVHLASFVRNFIPINFKANAEKYGPITFIKVHGSLPMARNWGIKQSPITIVQDTRTHRWSVMWDETSNFNSKRFTERMLMIEAQSRNMSIDELKAKGLAGGGPPYMWTTPAGKGRDTMIQNMKETLLHLAYSCFREYCAAS